MDVGDLGEEFGSKQIDEPWPVEIALRLDHVETVSAPRDPFSGPESLQELGQRLARRYQGPGEGRDGEQAVGLGQRLGVRGR